MTPCSRQPSRFCSLVPSNALLVLSVLLLVAGCRSTDRSRPDPVPGNPSTWQTIRIRQHLSFFNSVGLRGRSSAGGGTSGAARYLADRLGEAGYQPVLANEYRITQSVPMWTLDASFLSVIGRDSIRFDPGAGFLVDARSGGANIRIPRGLRVGQSGHFGDVAVAASSHGLTADAIGDARLVILTDSVSLGTGPPIRGGVPIIFPLPPFREHVGWPPLPTNGVVPRDRASRILPDIRVSVYKEFHVSAPVVQVAGMLTGRGLSSRDSLVVLLAPYDGFGMQGDRSWTTGEDLGMAASALLEVAVRSGIVQRDWRIFEKSVMIAFVSGTRGLGRGVDAWLDVLPWDRERISHLVLVSDIPCSEGCFDTGDVPFSMSKAPESARIVRLAPTRTDTSVVERRLREADFGILLRNELLRGAGLEAAAGQTLDLAQRVYEHLLDAAAPRKNES